MKLHPYLTPDLLTLIRTATPEQIEQRLRRVYSEIDTDLERIRLGFCVEAKKSGGTCFGIRLPRVIDGFAISGGYNCLKRRVDCSVANWRESFITLFNNVLHNCEKRLAASNAKRDANAEREQKVKARKSLVTPLVEPLPLSCAWYCEDGHKIGIAESLRIQTAALTPEQIAQIVNLVRSFQP
jgi:hypothetical protein